jgi:hypothetical protein
MFYGVVVSSAASMQEVMASSKTHPGFEETDSGRRRMRCAFPVVGAQKT